MTEASLTAAPVTEVQPKPPTNSIFRHAAYVVADNPVTGLSFALFVLIALCAVFGPYILPYDPLASNTSATLQSPSLHHWFGTDLLGRDIFSRVLAATRLDFTIAIASVALVLVMGGLAGIAAGFFGGWTDRIVGRVSDTIMAFPLFVLAMGIVAALGNTVTNIVIATAIINFPLYVRVARAEANVRREAGFVPRGAHRRQWRPADRAGAHPAQLMPIMMVQISLTMGYAILNAAGCRSSVSASSRRRRSGASWSRKARPNHLRRVVGGILPRRRVDDRGVLAFNLWATDLRDLARSPQRRT